MKALKVNTSPLALCNTIIFTGTVCAIAQLVALSPVAAKAVPKAVQEACKYDYKRLCRHYKPGTAKMRACMQASVGQISPRCYDTLIRYGYGKSGVSR